MHLLLRKPHCMGLSPQRAAALPPRVGTNEAGGQPVSVGTDSPMSGPEVAH